MANGYPAARTFDTVDGDTPIVSLGDEHFYRREHSVLCDDEERILLAHLVGRERIDVQHGIDNSNRKRWFDSWVGRLAVLAGLLGGTSELINTIRQLSGH